MELRSTSHLHFVNAIKGGTVEKSMNVGFRGRPALKFKGIKEIYNLRDTIYHNQVPAIYLRDDLDNSPTKCSGVKVERSDFSLVGEIKIKSEPETFDSNCNSDGGERIHDLDDLGFCNMTLKQIKKRCKKRKRKCSNFVGLNKETTETCSNEKHELPNILHEDGECDLEEPLISLKSKLSKNIKSKKSSRKNVSALAPSAMSLNKSKQVHCDEDLLQPQEHLLALVEVEVPEPGYSECQTIFSVTPVSDFSCSKQVDSTVTVSDDFAEVPNPTKEPQYDSLNEVSCEYSRNLEFKSDMRVSSWDIVKVDSPEIASYEYYDLLEFKKDNYIAYPLSYDLSSESMPLTKDYNNYSLIEVPESAIGLETSSTLYPVEDPLCGDSNGVSCEYLEDVIPKFGAGSSGWEIVKVDSPEMISYQCSGLQELGQETYTVCALPYDISPESMPPTKDCSADLNSFKSHSSEHEMAWQTSSHDRTEAPDMDSDDSLQCLENINEGSAYSNERNSAGRPLNSGISPSDDGFHWSSSCLNPVRQSVPVSSHSPSAGKQSQLPVSVATDDDALDKPMTSPGRPDFHQRMQQQQQHSERLPSSRKTISPTSQERLCRAMELTGLDEDEHQQCRGKLYFGKKNNHRILRAQGLDQFGRDGATIKPKPFMRKVKQDKRGSPPKGILKVTHLSGLVPQVSSSCTTVQRCSQSAIAFTQRQMRDIESLATKLTTELKSMKDIVMGKLDLELEASAATAVKENANEVRIAVESATKAEETARKWLSIMARDCNRFCKIMKSTEDNTASSERVIQKERKITFADEAGGKLCHVKIFKDDIVAASSLQRGTEETELQVD